MTAADEEAEFTELVDFQPDRTDLVGLGANGIPRFIIRKQAAGGLYEPAYVRDLIANGEPAPTGREQVTMPNGITLSGSPAEMAAFIHKAAVAARERDQTATAAEDGVSKMDMAVVDPEAEGDARDLDPTVPFAEPDPDMPGDPTDPGSPAWESADAASATRWLGIAARLSNALCLLAERELLEAAAADPDDAEKAWDLEDAKCAVEYAIEQLAVYAATEQAEAELGAEMAAIGKALAGAEPPLTVIEGLAVVRKAGRVLSTANEAKIRSAVEALQGVLASLPEAPVAKAKEGTMPQTTTAADVAKETAVASPDEQARETGPVQTGGTTVLGHPVTAAQAAGDIPVPLRTDPVGRTVIKSAGRFRIVPVIPVAKADGDTEGKATMQAVFDSNGNLVGIVDPADITPVSGTSKPDDAEPAAAEPAPDDMDLNPQPAADAGTPSDDVAKTAGGTPPAVSFTQDVLKSIAENAARTALASQEAAHQQVVAKLAADKAEQAKEIEALKARVAVVEEQPATPGVFANGQRPPQDARPPARPQQLRGQDQGAPPIPTAQAAVMKQRMYTADPAEANRIANDLNRSAIAHLEQIHARAGTVE